MGLMKGTPEKYDPWIMWMLMQSPTHVPGHNFIGEAYLRGLK